MAFFVWLNDYDASSLSISSKLLFMSNLNLLHPPWRLLLRFKREDENSLGQNYFIHLKYIVVRQDYQIESGMIF